jgi:hypothetical protein
VTGAGAFSVDVKNIYYSDPFGPRTVNNYNFSAGNLSANTISIPDTFVTKASPEAGLTYTFGPYPAGTETNDIAVTLDTNNQKATLSTATDGGCIINTSSPSTGNAGNEWHYAVQLRNFTGITDPLKEYGTEIGFGSQTDGPLPGLTARWTTPGTSSRDLILQAEIYDNTGTGHSDWSSQVILSGLVPADTQIELRIRRLVPATSGDMVFDYRLFTGGSWSAWTTIGTFDTTPPPDPFPYDSFPTNFPYVSLRVETAQTETDAFNVFSWHEQWTGNYGVSISVNDAGQALYSGVTAESTGISSGNPGYLAPGTALVYSNGMWNLSQTIPTWPTLPGFLPTYHIVATKKSGGADTRDKAVTGYVEQFATITSPAPAASVNTTPTFTWTWPSGAPAVSWYGIDVWDESTNPWSHVWTDYNLPGTQTSAVYNGPSLVNGHTYQCILSAGIETNGSGNNSMVQGTFTYTGPTATISFSGSVKTGGVSSSTPIIGATITAYTGSSLIASVTTDDSGNFVVSGIPQGQNTELLISKEGYVTAYSEIFNATSNIEALLPYRLFPSGQLATWGVTSGNGMIMGRIGQIDNPSAYLSGATVTAVNAYNQSITYPVVYIQADGSFSGTSTSTTGIFAVLNVPAGVTVKITASMPGSTFAVPSRWLTVRDGAISEASFFGNLLLVLKGDIDGNTAVNLADAILALQVVVRMNPSGIRADYANSGTDVNSDNKIGLQEAIFILQKTADLRQDTASGTYTYASNQLSLRFTSSTFPCNGPEIGEEDKTVTTLTETTLVFEDNDNHETMTWTRSGGTTGNIVGTWTTDLGGGNVLTATFDPVVGSNGPVSISGNIHSCGH